MAADSSSPCAVICSSPSKERSWAYPKSSSVSFPVRVALFVSHAALGRTRAKEMMMFGDPVPVEVALNWGLVNRVVPRGAALAETVALAQRLARGPAGALRACKAAIPSRGVGRCGE